MSVRRHRRLRRHAWLARVAWGLPLLAALIAGCGPRRLALPTGPGTPFPDFAAVHAGLAAACTGARTLTAELGLSGRAGDERLRGTVIAGFERPASMRLEGVAPFGPPAFILAARDGRGSLLLPRDERVLRDAPPEAILGALTGVSLAPADLQAIVSGCVVPAPAATAGRLHEGDWASIDVAAAGGEATATLFLRRDGGAWRLRAARRAAWEIEYPGWQGAFPSAVRLRGEAAAVDLSAAIAQLQANIDLDPAAFTFEVPPGARPLDLDELRQAGPLRGQ